MKRLAARPEKAQSRLAFFMVREIRFKRRLFLDHSEEVFDSVGLAPAYQRISAEAAISSHQDLYQGPFVTDQLYQALQYFQGPVAGVDVGFPQPPLTEDDR